MPLSHKALVRLRKCCIVRKNMELVLDALRKSGLSEGRTEEVQKLFESGGQYRYVERFMPVDKGMTNRLFYFTANGKEYLLRIPGEGSEYLVNRRQEAWVYRTLADQDITDRYVYMNPETGLKITEYISDVHCCDMQNMEEVHRCIRHLYHFHSLRLESEEWFDIFEKLREYERACRHEMTLHFPNYRDTREKIGKLKKIIENSPREYCLCHIDSVPDNFLVREDKVFLIDWEYAAMADPHMDIAMFCIYAGYDKEQIDRVTKFYFEGTAPKEIRRKIYCYIAVGGLLWTVWCEIKRDSGVVFDEYEKIQYRYAVEYYDYAIKEWDGNEETV